MVSSLDIRLKVGESSGFKEEDHALPTSCSKPRKKSSYFRKTTQITSFRMNHASSRKPVVIVHGGAWAIPEKLSDESKDGVKLAAKKAYEILKCGQSAIDAVESAVVLLENNPAFDAGKGSCLNAEGGIEMDALIMEGTTLNAGMKNHII